MSNITFTMLKPDSIRNGNTGAILDKIVKSGFKIKAMKFTKMTDEKASKFYAIHSERPFFKDLVGWVVFALFFSWFIFFAPNIFLALVVRQS